MRKTLKRGATGMVVLLRLLGHGAPAAAAEVVPLTVVVVNDAGVPGEVLDRAETEAGAIFARTGVQIVWWKAGAQATHLMVSRPYVLKIVARTVSAVCEGASAMGVAPAAQLPSARLIYAFYGMIETLARAHDLDVAVLLGDVIAHELGHLLLPYPSHSAAGIMYGAWDAKQLQLVAQEMLQFTNAEAIKVRGHLARNAQ